MDPNNPAIRELLLTAAARFVQRASAHAGVRRLALFGSLTTPKPNPKDADLLVTVDDAADLKGLAVIGRQLIGETQNRGDTFLADPRGTYLGRLCSYRECHPRMRCLPRICAVRPYLCDDHRVLTLRADVIESPPIELWPAVIRRVRVPEDVERLLLRPLEAAGRGAE